MEMLDLCYENVDYVSLHRYYQNLTNDLPNFLAKSVDMDAFIKTVVSMCDAIGGKKHSKKKLNLSFDEWNVWYHSNQRDEELKSQSRWGRSLPLLEDVYNFEDALLIGGLLITLINNSDRVKIACLAQLVNVIAPIMTSAKGCWAQTIYWPYLHASLYGRGISLRPVVKSPVYSSKDFDDVPVIDSAAVLADDGSLTIFVLNRSTESDVELSLDLRSFEKLELKEHIVLHHDDIKAENTESDPGKVVPFVKQSGQSDKGKFAVNLPPLSWNVLRFS
jgi:alpha-N-arabinofuranosidase